MSLRDSGGVEAIIGFTTSESIPDDRKNLGPSNIENVPLVRINLLSQVRQDYDPDGIDELAASMEPSEEDGDDIEVHHTPIVARLTYSQAIDYIAKINEVFSATHSIENLAVLGDEANEHKGKYLVVVAGHRRTLAVVWRAMTIGEDPRGYNLRSNVIEGDKLTFSSAIAIQYKENFHRRPDSWEDAFAINAIYKEGVENGRYSCYADCANHLKIDADRVGRAYRFQTLPEPVRNLVRDGTLQFGRALMLTKIFVAIALNECQSSLKEEQKNEFTKKLQDNKLYLPELMEYIAPERQAALRDIFMAHTAKITTFPTNNKASVYAEQIVNAKLAGVVDLRLILATEAEAQQENDTITRKVARNVAVEALRTLVATLRGDQIRIADGRQTVLGHSARVNHLLKVMNDGIDAAQHVKGRSEEERQDLIIDGVAAGTALAYEIEYVNNGDEENPEDTLVAEPSQKESIF